jgi:hypothetical protein
MKQLKLLKTLEQTQEQRYLRIWQLTRPNSGFQSVAIAPVATVSNTDALVPHLIMEFVQFVREYRLLIPILL